MNSITTDNQYDFLLKIGFSLNEAKVYITLLQNKALNGYEIAKFSGVSRSLVYDVIDRLLNKGFIIKSDGTINYYVALDYDKAIEKIDSENRKNLIIAEEKLKALSKKDKDNEFIFNIKGFDKFIEKAKEVISLAKKEISISIWKQEFELIKDDIFKAIGKGVKVYIFSFEDIELKGARIFSYKVKDATNLFPYRRTTIIIDSNDTLIGENSGEQSISVYTKNAALVSLATDEIVLNIFWYKLIKKNQLLEKCSTSAGFLQVIDRLRREMDITPNMTKNFMVFDFQYGGNKNGRSKNWKIKS